MEIIGGVKRRRQWRPEEKFGLLPETEAPGAGVAPVVHRYDVSRGQLPEVWWSV
jgi:transposase-like protein